jgi:hypothetical protein
MLTLAVYHINKKRKGSHLNAKSHSLFIKLLRMGKSKHFQGDPVFGQLVKLLPKNALNEVIREQEADKFTKKFYTWDHLITMLFGAFTHCSSLREIETGIEGFDSRMHHAQLQHFPGKSTFADANQKRNAKVFEQIFNSSYNYLKQFLPDSCPSHQEWVKDLFLVDSTTITLFKNIMKSAGRPAGDGKKKGGVKIHVGMHHNEDAPSVVRLTSSATHDSQFLKNIDKLPEGSILVFDKAYRDYKRFNEWNEKGFSWVTRLKRGSQVSVQQDLEIDQEDQEAGVLKDQHVELGHSAQKEKVICRLIEYQDKDNNKFQFITNDFQKSPSQIALIYKQRWQIELLFKRLKQNLQLGKFLGDNENAIRIQIWCNLLADLLLMVIKSGVKRKWSYSTLAGLVRLHAMNYINIKELLKYGGKQRGINKTAQSQREFDYANPP